uniref:Uncharacterized protein n=1 Tax=Steinernema glaseri TaxID=37863 RepID=A0A1I7Y3K2_9BILA
MTSLSSFCVFFALLSLATAQYASNGQMACNPCGSYQQQYDSYGQQPWYQPQSQNYGNYQQGQQGAYGQRLRDPQTPPAGEPGYLPDYRGDQYTNPKRIEETRALNKPFFDSIGGEPIYPGGVQTNQNYRNPQQTGYGTYTPSQTGYGRQRRHIGF